LAGIHLKARRGQDESEKAGKFPLYTGRTRDLGIRRNDDPGRFEPVHGGTPEGSGKKHGAGPAGL
jgi:hypothetical protein